MTLTNYFNSYWLIKVIYKLHASEIDLVILNFATLLLLMHKTVVPAKKLLLLLNRLNQEFFTFHAHHNALRNQIFLH